MPGTHWVHPHRHGSSVLHTGGGAAAAIIVADPPGTLPPVVEMAEDMLLLVQQLDLPRLERIAEQSGDVWTGSSNSIDGSDGDRRDDDRRESTEAANVAYITVNGQVDPTISLDAGAWIRFRVIFAAWVKGNLDMEIPGCELQLLAKDGIYIVDFPRRIETAAIVPGGRADIMVRCPTPSTVYYILAHGGSRRIASIVTSPSAPRNEGDLPSWTPVYSSYLTSLLNTPVTPGRSCSTRFDGDGQQFEVNGALYNDAAVLHTSVLGSVVERSITVRDHPYHQHVYPFQLVAGFSSRNGDGYNVPGDWHDSIDGEGLLRYRPTEYLGKVMVHCHQLEHEDLGMVATEYVVDDANAECTCTPASNRGRDVDNLAVAVSVPVAVLVVLCSCGLGWWSCYRRGGVRGRL